jgi:hypothetical protein
MLTVEDHRHDCIDACDLRRRGLLDGGGVEIDPGLKWPKLSNMLIEQSCIRITFKGERRSGLSGRQQWIAISWARAFSRGYRPWLVCPQCAERAARLYCVFGDYRCKHCAKLVHQCQAVSSKIRLKAKLAKIYGRLGYSKQPQTVRRPIFMRWWTYSALRNAEREALRKIEQYRHRNVRAAQWL